MSDITHRAGIRQNLLSLQQTADLMATTQDRLATGKKINSALDNPVSYFTSQSSATALPTWPRSLTRSATPPRRCRPPTMASPR